MTSKQPSVRYSIEDNRKDKTIGKNFNWLVYKFTFTGEEVYGFNTNKTAKSFVRNDKKKTKETQVRQSINDQLGLLRDTIIP